jgi:hypothetical protein
VYVLAIAFIFFNPYLATGFEEWKLKRVNWLNLYIDIVICYTINLIYKYLVVSIFYNSKDWFNFFSQINILYGTIKMNYQNSPNN